MISRRLLVAVGHNGMGVRRCGALRSELFALSRLRDEPDLDWLTDALRAARDALGVEARTATDVVVLRPLALGKILDLPPVKSRALRALCVANLDRFFPVGADSWSADAVPLTTWRAKERPTLVAALPAETVRVIRNAAEAAGLRVARIVPAPAAAAVYAEHLVRCDQCPPSCRLELHLPGVPEHVHLLDGSPAGLIPVPASNRVGPVERGEDDLVPSCPATLRGWELALTVAEVVAVRRRVPRPLPADLHHEWRGIARKRAACLFAAACVALLAALGLQVSDQRRELASLRAVRAAIAPDVERVIADRETVARLAETDQRLASAERAPGRWPELFRDLAGDLPPELYAARIAGRPDSLVLEIRTSGPASSTELDASLSHFEIRDMDAADDGEVRLLARWHGGAGRGVTGEE